MCIPNGVGRAPSLAKLQEEVTCHGDQVISGRDLDENLGTAEARGRMIRRQCGQDWRHVLIGGAVRRKRQLVELRSGIFRLMSREGLRGI